MIKKIRTYFRGFSSRLSQVLNSPTPWIFIFGAAGLGLISEGLSKLIDYWFQEDISISGWLTTLIGVIFILIVVFLFDLPRMFRRWLSHDEPQDTQVNVGELVPQKRGLVALVSRGPETPAAMAMKYHFQDLPGADGDRYCWLLTGPDTDEGSSQRNARALESEFEAKGVHVDVWPIQDADNPGEVFRAVQIIFQVATEKHGLKPEEMIADFTGGTKCMTVGMVLAFIDKDGDLQYMKPNQYDPYGRAIREAGSRPHLVDVDFITQDTASA